MNTHVPKIIAASDTAVTLTDNDVGFVLVPDLDADCTFTLPSPDKGRWFEFSYSGVAADAHDWIIDSGSDTNYFVGGLSYVDDAPAANAVAGDGNSNSKVTILVPEPGTQVRLVGDGTLWHLSGWVAAASAPTFADQ